MYEEYGRKSVSSDFELENVKSHCERHLKLHTELCWMNPLKMLLIVKRTQRGVDIFSVVASSVVRAAVAMGHELTNFRASVSCDQWSRMWLADLLFLGSLVYKILNFVHCIFAVESGSSDNIEDIACTPCIWVSKFSLPNFSDLEFYSLIFIFYFLDSFNVEN